MLLQQPNTKWGISRGYGKGHNGIDYKYPMNTPVTAAADGTVGFEGWGQNDSWTLWLGGIYVRIQHSDGSWTGYAHLSKTTVSKGQKVTKGQVIGYSGNTGESTGAHLHFEVIPKVQDWHNGYAARIDPAPFFAAAVKPKLVLWDGNIKTNSRVNVRTSPSIGNNVKKTNPAGSVITIVGYIKGTEVNGNNVWLKTWNGYYIHSGATNYPGKRKI